MKLRLVALLNDKAGKDFREKHWVHVLVKLVPLETLTNGNSFNEVHRRKFWLKSVTFANMPKGTAKNFNATFSTN